MYAVGVLSTNNDTMLCTTDRLDTFPQPDFHKLLRGPPLLAPTRFPLCAMSTHPQKSVPRGQGGTRRTCGAQAPAAVENDVFPNQDSATAVAHAAAGEALAETPHRSSATTPLVSDIPGTAHVQRPPEKRATHHGRVLEAASPEKDSRHQT